MSTRSAETVANVTRSVALTLNSRLLMTRVIANDPTNPTPTSIKASFHRRDVTSVGAESDADPDFVGALRHPVRHDAVQAHRPQGQGYHGEEAHQDHDESGLRDRG